MTRDYKSGKIYKILSERGNCVYYGSTICTLKKRLSEHKSRFKHGVYCCSCDVLKYPDYIIVLVEEYPCNNRLELCQREGWYISNNKCVNKQIAGRTHKEYLKQYRKENKQYFKQYFKQYQIDNKQYINQRLMCDCGVSYSRHNKYNHNKTKRHIQYTINPFSTMLI